LVGRYICHSYPLHHCYALYYLRTQFSANSAAFTVADIGGANSVAWLGTASTVATAAVAPFAGAISDLVGRRYVALSGSVLIMTGMLVIGTAERMDVAIGGSAIVGVGGAFAELVGFAGISELYPPKLFEYH